MSRGGPLPVDHPVVVAVAGLAAEGWRGTAGQLWARLELAEVDELPVDGQRLVDRLRSSESTLADVGVRVRRSKVRGQRMLTIALVEAHEPVALPDPAPAPLAPKPPARGMDPDRVPWYAVGRHECPECFTVLDDPSLVRNRRIEGLEGYPDRHTLRACRVEQGRFRALEAEAERAQRPPRGLGDIGRVMALGPPW